MFSYNSMYEKLLFTVTSSMIMRIYYHTVLTDSDGKAVQATELSYILFTLQLEAQRG